MEANGLAWCRRKLWESSANPYPPPWVLRRRSGELEAAAGTEAWGGLLFTVRPQKRPAVQATASDCLSFLPQQGLDRDLERSTTFGAPHSPLPPASIYRGTEAQHGDARPRQPRTSHPFNIGRCTELPGKSALQMPDKLGTLPQLTPSMPYPNIPQGALLRFKQGAEPASSLTHCVCAERQGGGQGGEKGPREACIPTQDCLSVTLPSSLDRTYSSKMSTKWEMVPALALPGRSSGWPVPSTSLHLSVLICKIRTITTLQD